MSPKVSEWYQLPASRQLPWTHRGWATWLRYGPRRRTGGTFGGNPGFTLASILRRITGDSDGFWPLRDPSLGALVVDLYDFESFHHAFWLWSTGDCFTTLLDIVLDSGSVFVDVGANFGAYTLRAGRRRARVVAIEPQPRPREALRRSVAMNNFASTEIVAAAAGAKIGTAKLARSGAGSGSASMVRGESLRSQNAITVPLITVDQVCQDSSLAAVDLLKVDVEGAEADVLRGAHRTLALSPLVFFEHSGDADRSAFEVLEQAGYQHFFDETSVREGRAVPPRLGAPLTNVLAVPDSKLSWLAGRGLPLA